jgi:hypothetical protein
VKENSYAMEYVKEKTPEIYWALNMSHQNYD